MTSSAFLDTEKRKILFMKKLLLLLFLLPYLALSKEIFINEQGVKVEYSKPLVPCLYDREAYEGYLNTCLLLPNYEICAQRKYEIYICDDKNMLERLEKKSKGI